MTPTLASERGATDTNSITSEVLSIKRYISYSPSFITLRNGTFQPQFNVMKTWFDYAIIDTAERELSTCSKQNRHISSSIGYDVQDQEVIRNMLQLVINLSTILQRNMVESCCGKLEGSQHYSCLLYTSPSPRDRTRSRMPSSA